MNFGKLLGKVAKVIAPALVTAARDAVAKRLARKDNEK